MGCGEWREEPEKPDYPARTRAITGRDDVRVRRDTEEKGCPGWDGGVGGRRGHRIRRWEVLGIIL